MSNLTAHRVLSALGSDIAAAIMEPINFDRESAKEHIMRLRMWAAPWTGDMTARAMRLRQETGCTLMQAYCALR